MHNGFVHSTGNNLLNPIPVSTWVPTYPDPRLYGPSNEFQALGLADYAYSVLRNVFSRNPLSRFTAQQIGGAAARQTAALGTQGVDLALLQRRLTLNTPLQRFIPRGQLLGRVAAPLYFAETLGGSTPSPSQAQEMIAQPFTPAPVTAFLENLLGIPPTAPPVQSAQPQQQVTPGGRQPFPTARTPVTLRGPRYLRSRRGRMWESKI